MLKILITCFSIVLVLSTSAQVVPVYFGSYTNNGSTGVHVYSFDQTNGKSQFLKSITTSNPSFLARNGNILYFVNENTEGGLSAYDLSKNSFLSSLPTGGAHPCHVSLSPNQPLIIASNYSGGSLVLYSINADGSIRKQEDFIQFTGSGVNKERQEKSHIHSAFFTADGKFVFVSDLGADFIYKMKIEETDGSFKFNIVDEIKIQLGGGPRHVVIEDNGNRLYVVLELTGEIEVLENSANGYVSKQVVPIYSDGFSGEHGAADIKIAADGKYLYASNRGTSNEIVVYKVKKNGLLQFVQIVSSEGNSPRNIQLSPDDKWLFVTNQLSGDVQIFSRNTKNGKLSITENSIAIPSVVCTIF